MFSFKKIACCIVFFLVYHGVIQAQVQSVNLKVISDGKIVSTSQTQLGKNYRITIEGTYSMWPQFTDCHGVDGVYVYDVPKEELDNFRWPPLFMFPLPIWVGDSAKMVLPTLNFSMRTSKGFRIDGEPIQNIGFEKNTHRYQIEKIGTGKPFQFQILDSNYNLQLETMIGRYEDNCGGLNVIVEWIDTAKPDVNICDIKTICDKNKEIIGVQIWASIFETDTANVKNRKNILQTISLNQIGIVENGKFRCDIDSIKCGLNSVPLAIGLLIDRSGSMGLPISFNDNTIRMAGSKKAINGFIDNLRAKDSCFVMSFSNDIRIDQDWTSSKDLLKTAINTLQPENKTNFYFALADAAKKVSLHKNPNKFLIALSDGCNTFPDPFPKNGLDSIKTELQKINIPIYIIALGLSTDSCDIISREIMGQIATMTRGKAFDVNNSKQLDSVYLKLSQAINEEDCCAIYFKVDSCTPGSKHFVRLIYAPKDTVIVSKVISFYCDSCSIITSVKPIDDDPVNKANTIMSVNPNPFDQLSKVNFVLNSSGNIVLTITNLFGEKVMSADLGYFNTGNYEYLINGSNIQSGNYIATIFHDGYPVSRKIIIIH